jgi:hypothetical protein
MLFNSASIRSREISLGFWRATIGVDMAEGLGIGDHVAIVELNPRSPGFSIAWFKNRVV